MFEKILADFLIAFIIVLIAAFFAGIEASFFSIDKVKIKRLSNTGDKKQS